MEYLLREALRAAGRLKKASPNAAIEQLSPDGTSEERDRLD
jgi:hypothetical protein